MNPLKILVLVAVFYSGVNSAFGQTWQQSFTFHIPWTAVASSADGTKVLAVNTNGPIYYSTNSGAAWKTMSGYTSAYYIYYKTAVASSADGSVLAVTTGHGQAGPIIISTNSGGAWVTNAPKEYWTCIASSADGSQLVAAATNGAVYISTNQGGDWAPSSAPDENWISVSSSSDGSQLALVATNNGPICISTNGGNTWMTINADSITSNTNWQAVAWSADKTKLVAAANGGFIYISTNAGSTWTAAGNAPSTNWQAVACSADGAKMVAAINNGPVYTSTDAGTTWVSNSVPNFPWASVSSSADGSKLVAVAGIKFGSAPVYTLQSTPNPRLNLLVAGGGVTVSWTVPSTNFVMQQSSDLKNWTNTAITPTLNLTNLQEQVILSPTNGSSFYRLTTP